MFNILTVLRSELTEATLTPDPLCVLFVHTADLRSDQDPLQPLLTPSAASIRNPNSRLLLGQIFTALSAERQLGLAGERQT